MSGKSYYALHKCAVVSRREFIDPFSDILYC